MVDKLGIIFHRFWLPYIIPLKFPEMRPLQCVDAGISLNDKKQQLGYWIINM